MPSSRHPGIRAPRTARNASEKGEAFGVESYDFATRRFMQRDVDIEIHDVDKSGGFIGALYLNKTENAALLLLKEGLASVHDYSADGLSYAKQLYDAEVRGQFSLMLSLVIRILALLHRLKQRRPIGMCVCSISSDLLLLN